MAVTRGRGGEMGQPQASGQYFPLETIKRILGPQWEQIITTFVGDWKNTPYQFWPQRMTEHGFPVDPEEDLNVTMERLKHTWATRHENPLFTPQENPEMLRAEAAARAELPPEYDESARDFEGPIGEIPGNLQAREPMNAGPYVEIAEMHQRLKQHWGDTKDISSEQWVNTCVQELGELSKMIQDGKPVRQELVYFAAMLLVWGETTQ